MNELQKVTIEYDENEDRIRLAGEGTAGDRTVIWLSNRLLRRLIPLLVDWIGKEARASGMAETILGFEQDAARAALGLQEPVRVGGADSSWLVHVIDLRLAEEVIRLEFRGRGGSEAASLAVDILSMRQWLSIVHAQFIRAEWALDIWPRWMEPQGGAMVGSKELLN